MTVRRGLGILLAFVACNAFGGGVYGLTGAKAVPRAWLAGSPFDSYVVPSAFLLVVVGGSMLAAAIAVFANARSARTLALVAGLVLFAWIAVQVAIIGYVSWLQPAMALAALAILVLATRM